MALITCDGCGENITDSYNFCPHCNTEIFNPAWRTYILLSSKLALLGDRLFMASIVLIFINLGTILIGLNKPNDNITFIIGLVLGAVGGALKDKPVSQDTSAEE